MEALPSGTVTFLFTDIEGSTKLAQEHPDEIPALLARHHEILHQSIQSQNGYVFQVIGDAFCVAFHSASNALNAALQAQQVLQNESWNPASIKVRMGIHTGSVQLTDENLYSGYTTLALTQRIMSAGHGGQILISSATRELVRDTLPEKTELKNLGEKRLKDLLRPAHLYQLDKEGLATAFPPLKTLDSFPNNLPIHLTSFIGREKEIAEVKQELEAHRLVTLTGSGGTGKTRLSLQVAAELLEKFDHGVWFIELAPLADPDLIPQTILSTFGIKDQSGKEPLELLKIYLQEKQSLIVLDNCEHLISASAQVVNVLLRAAPRIKVMASSREALGVRGEVSYPVPSLTLPNIKHLPDIEQLSQFEAVRLFIDRALLVAPHFEVDKDNAPYIAQICHRLDGIPLAIELAAARAKVLSMDQISKRLDDRFRLLTGGARTALPRQQTLRALIDWSYDILDENEQLLLLRLSVFAGGWTLEAAEEVCVGDEIESFDVLDLLSQLVNKSLVVVTNKSKSGETRYTMLETIRQYARDKLLETGGGESVRDKHLAYFVKLTEQAEPELYRANQVFWINKLDDELDNISRALEWAMITDAESGLKILFVTTPYLRVDINDVASWLANTLNIHDKEDTLHVNGLVAYGWVLLAQNKVLESHKVLEQSLELSRSISDKKSEAFSLHMLGRNISTQGDLKKSTPILEQSLILYKELGDKIGQVNVTGALYTNNSDIKRSKVLLSENLELCREMEHLAGIAYCLYQLSLMAIREGDLLSPVPWLDEARELYRQLENIGGQGDISQLSGLLAYWKGDYEQASSHYIDAITLFERDFAGGSSDWTKIHLAYAFLRQGDIQQAKGLFEIPTQHFKESGSVIGMVYTIEGLASLHLNHNQPERAAQLFAWADAMRDTLGDQRPPVEQTSVEKDLAVIHSQLDDATFEKLWENGSTLSLEQAIALALEE